jgi:hypothetical protein
MKYSLKQNPIFRATVFFMVAIFLLTISSCKNNNCKNKDNNNYQEFFIAHAGGAIDGINYTNSLEAMDLSYSKGCRLFELDLVLTTDGKIVAQHDPPGITEEEFMSRLIKGKYTPMNMEAINCWFSNHPDAILVTDKINDPQRIYDEFLFRDRLIMELFSWETVDKAIELGIKPMVSGGLIFSTPNIEQILEDKKIEYICMGRGRIVGNEKFLKRLKKKGIKNYLFHLEWEIDGQPPEQYVWKHEMKFCYGMYANDLDILYHLLNDDL